MLPLVGLAATFVPELIQLIAGDKAGTIAKSVEKTVMDVTKTSDPAEALKALQADAATAADLRIRLAQIAVDAQKAQNDEADKKRQDELSTLQANMSNTRDARGTLLGLAQAKSSIAWGAPVVSTVVTVGFFVILALFLLDGKKLSADTTFEQLLYISIGTLGTSFATVVNFWLGSSQGSRDKDLAALQLQATHADQLDKAIDTVKSMSSTGMHPPGATIPAAKSDNFDRCVATTLSYEGGFVDNKDDPGGATNFGITRRTLEAFLGRAVTIAEVQNLSSNTAIEIYRANYWNQMLCSHLPAGVDLMIFDYGVHSGTDQAVKTLQSLAGVPQDGAMGKITLPAVNKAIPRNLINDLFAARKSYLQTLANYPQNQDGWTRRLIGVQEKALEMNKMLGTPPAI